MKTDNEVIQTNSMKGLPCPIVKDRMLTCQEGYCQGCQIYLDHHHISEDKAIANNMRDYWMHRADGAE